jgi:hypothetical protein
MTNPRAPILYSALADLGLVLTFVAIGRSSHHESGSLLGFLGTAWPFVVGLGIGWVVVRAWRAPTRVLRTGVGVWGMTVVAGLVLRAVSGQGVQLSFVIVTALVLALFLLGWRAVVRWTSRSRRPA